MRGRVIIALALVLGAINPLQAATQPPPPQAVSAGYKTPVLLDDFNSNTIGVHWFAFNRDGGNLLTTGDPRWSQAFIQDGKLIIKTDVSGYGSGLQSINYGHAPTSTPTRQINYGSRLFRFGYFEARMKFDPHGYKGGNGWPAFWAGSLVRGYPHSEIDFMEAQQNRAHTSAVISSTIHEWLSKDSSKTNGKTEITPPDDFDPNGFNTYGCLWTPHAITFYINNQIAVMKEGTNPTPIGEGTVFRSATGDGQVLVLGTGRDWPVEFEFVHVYQ